MNEIDLLLANKIAPIIDVRSESEFKQGHIPGALNQPLLNDEERKKVGICYKLKGKEEAVNLGYELVGHKFAEKLNTVRKITQGNAVSVYCWRGGLRSKIFSQLLENGGFEVLRLSEGYKSYRQWALNEFNRQFKLIILGGKTGTGKTEILKLLKNKGEQVIDLEFLAHHKGSVYGGIKMEAQESTEQFENQLAFELSQFNIDQSIWIENESRTLGNIKLPDSFYSQMKSAQVINLELPINIRIERIKKEYASLPKDQLINSTLKLEKRLGNMNMNKAINHLKNDEFSKWIKILLVYYDKTYIHGNSLRKDNDLYNLALFDNNTLKNTKIIMNYFYENIVKQKQ
jgi:tRNA 2-selenouridine synthase